MNKKLKIKIGDIEYMQNKINNHFVSDVEIQENFISVQKVKDKIEEILNDGECITIFEGDAEFPDEATTITSQKYIKLERIQELLKGIK